MRQLHPHLLSLEYLYLDGHYTVMNRPDILCTRIGEEEQVFKRKAYSQFDLLPYLA